MKSLPKPILALALLCGPLLLFLICLQLIRSLAGVLGLMETGGDPRAISMNTLAVSCVAVSLLFVIAVRFIDRPFEFPVFSKPRLAGWFWALLLVALYAGSLVTSILANQPILEQSWFNFVGSLLGGTTGAMEELLFRGIIIALAVRLGFGITMQILISGVGFGVAHAGWTIITGNLAAGLSVMFWTTLLGTALAGIYLASGRRLLPAMAAHAAINVIIEPWLLVAAISGAMAGAGAH